MRATRIERKRNPSFIGKHRIIGDMKYIHHFSSALEARLPGWQRAKSSNDSFIIRRQSERYDLDLISSLIFIVRSSLSRVGFIRIGFAAGVQMQVASEINFDRKS